MVGDRQFSTFIDPKGKVRLERTDDSKIVFHRTIEDVEIKMGDPTVTLNPFIVTNTGYEKVASWGPWKDELREHRVLFQQDNRDCYIETMPKRILQAQPASSIT